MRIRGELAKLGITISATAIRTVLRRHGLGPAPRRSGPTWSEFLRVQAKGIIAVDFFTVETAWLHTLYVFFAIELRTRHVHLAAATRHPNAAWVTQQARNLSEHPPLRFLIRDRDSKFTESFDAVFAAEGITTILTPFQAPRANAFAERWVRTVRWECLDWTLVLGWRHLEQVLRVYVAHTTRGGHTAGWTSGRLTRRRPPRRRARTELREGAISWAGSSMSTNRLHETQITSYRAPQVAGITDCMAQPEPPYPPDFVCTSRGWRGLSVVCRGSSPTGVRPVRRRLQLKLLQALVGIPLGLVLAHVQHHV
jgi:hypothetical protein